MDSSDHKPETSNNKSPPMSPKAADGHIPSGPETEGRLSVVSSSSTSSFNSIVNTDDIEMEDDEEEEFEKHKPPMSPQSSSNNLTSVTNPSNTASIDGTIGSSSSDQLEPYTVYDSSRIPSAVFSRKPTNRMDWSVASNESLFSIHMGNNSFSMGPDMMLPFEFGNEGKQGLNDANAPFGLPTTAEEDGVENSTNNSSRMSSISSNLKEEDQSMIRKQPTPMIPKKDEMNHSFDITQNVQEPMIPVSTGGTCSVGGGDRDMPTHTRDSSSIGTHVSRESGTSSSSFAFPLLTGESGTNTQCGTKKRLNAATPAEQPAVAITDDHDRVEEKPKSGPQNVAETEEKEAAAAAAKPANGGEKKSSWLSCFSCFSSCPFNCKMPNQSGCFAKGNNKVDKVEKVDKVDD